MTKQQLHQLESMFRVFIDFVDTRDSEMITRARTHDFATLLQHQHGRNKITLESALAHIVAVKNTLNDHPDLRAPSESTY